MRDFWKKISRSGVDESMPIEAVRKIILSNQLSLILFAALISLNLFFVVYKGIGFTLNNVIAFLSIFVLLLVPFFNAKGFYKVSVIFLAILVPVLTQIFSIKAHHNFAPVHVFQYYFPRLVLVSELILPFIIINSKHKYLLIFAVLFNVMCLIGFDYFVEIFGKPYNSTEITLEGYDILNYLIILPISLIVFGLLFLNKINQKYENKILKLNDELQYKNKALEETNEEVVAQHDEILEKNELLQKANVKIERYNKDLTDSISYAERIQRAILDEEKLPDGYFADSFVFFKPKSMVSGDFYYYSPYIINNQKCIVIAAVDCTGHGVPGGFLSMLGMAFINEILQTNRVSNAADILNQLRDKIKLALKQSGKQTEQKDGMDLALCIYYPELKKIDFSGARNPAFIVKKGGDAITLKADRQPIGIYLKEKDFTNQEVVLEGGDMIYMFSDGIPDQFGGQNKKFMLKYLKQYLIEISAQPCSVQKQMVDELMYNWMKKTNGKSYDQTDDMLLMGLRVEE